MTRHCISCLNDLICQDFRCFQFATSVETEQFVFHKHNQLKSGIEQWTKLFQSIPLGRNPKIGIIHELNFEYICILFAAIQVGANFVILDSRFDSLSTHKPALPLDILVHDYCIDIVCDDIEYWKTNAMVLVDARDVEKTKNHDNTAYDTILDLDFDFDATQSKILISSTSGTTGPAKMIDHTYQYILEISKRNARVLNLTGRVAHIKNLYHGSSLPVFYLPSMLASNFHFCIPWVNDLGNENSIAEYVDTCLVNTEILNINHILFPYKHMIDRFLEAVHKYNLIFDGLRIYTLSYIDPAYKKFIANRNIEIISIFGCTETSGPIMVNSLSNSNFDTFNPMVFYKLDDFFELTLMSTGTRVQSKNGHIDHVMNDLFEQIDETHYRHLGRTDLYRINDTTFDLGTLNSIRDRLRIDGDIVVDSQMQSIYLVLWNHGDASKVRDVLDQELRKTFANDQIKISKCLNLNKLDFISGIKVNIEKIKQVFRNFENADV